MEENKNKNCEQSEQFGHETEVIRRLNGFAWVKSKLFRLLKKEYEKTMDEWSALQSAIYWSYKIALGYLKCSYKEKCECEDMILEDIQREGV
ncbi:MAG: hypothetical protein WC974_08435 [Thermoplasmata archaeon]